MDPVQKSRRERWTAEAVKALQKAVETHLRGDNDVNWAGVARELGTTADRVKKKWRKLQKNDNTGAVSEPGTKQQGPMCRIYTPVFVCGRSFQKQLALGHAVAVGLCARGG